MKRLKKGKFESGNAPSGDYADASRLVLVNPDMFSFNRAEKMQMSITPCNGIKRKHIVNAQYENGFSSFSTFISMAVTDYIGHYNIRDFHDQLTITGVISTDGRIVDLNANTVLFSEDFVRGLINRFRSVPPLQPATADGKPVRQKFSIIFTFDKGVYSFSYRFFAIDQKTL